MDVGIRNPKAIHFVLEACLPALEMHGKMQGKHESQQRYDKGKEANVAIASRECYQENPAGQGNERDQGQDPTIQGGVHRTPIHTM
jgi:hypothetical protein